MIIAFLRFLWCAAARRLDRPLEARMVRRLLLVHVPAETKLLRWTNHYVRYMTDNGSIGAETGFTSSARSFPGGRQGKQERGERMVSFWWVVAAFFGGGAAVLLMALMHMAGGLPDPSAQRVDLNGLHW
jgi:hypothetical protein